MLINRETDSHRKRRYPIRNEISQIVADKNIPKERFDEFSKTAYKNVYGKFFYTFAEHSNLYGRDAEYFRINSVNECEFFWKQLRDDLEKKNIAVWNSDWLAYCREIKNAIPEADDKKLFLILREGWVYEGYADEIIDVLAETSILLNDFYIVPKKFDWFIGHSDDGECAYIYFNKKYF